MSCSREIPSCTSLVAWAAASRTSLVENRWESRALAAYVNGTLGPAGHDSGVERNGHADDCRALGPGCSKRKQIVPFLVAVRMSPLWIFLILFRARVRFDLKRFDCSSFD